MPETASHSTARPPRPPPMPASPLVNPLEEGTVGSQFSTVTPNGTPFLSDQNGDFELMNVKVTVLGLTGIIKENVPGKKKKPFSPSNARTGYSSDASRSGTKSPRSRKNPQGSTVSSLSSTDLSTDFENMESDQIPTVAIVAFQRNVTNSDTVIATHLPSHPLGMPLSTVGPLSRYVANWPTESHSYAQQVGAVDRASFTLLRVMMKDPTVKEDATNTVQGSKRSKSSSRSSYATENIDIHIGLGRGKDIIPLGVASLVITGEEEGAELMVLPAKPLPPKGQMILGGAAGSRKRRNRLFKSGKKSTFPGDPTKTFKLDENASLRVMVKVLPNNAVFDSKSKEMEAAELIEKITVAEEPPKCQTRVEIENIKQEIGATINRAGAHIVPQTQCAQTDDTFSFLGRNFLCGCSPLGPEGETFKAEEQPKDIINAVSTVDSSLDNTAMDSYGPKFGTSFNSSEMSSVSESETFTDDETENSQVHLNRKIFVRKKLSFRKQHNSKEVQAARAALRKQAQILGVKPKDLL